MKRQGEQGFTWDSKAEEWARWSASVWEHDKPRTEKLKRRHIAMMQAYGIEHAENARHSPTQQQNDHAIGVTTSQYRKAPLWPVLAVSVVAGIVAIVLVWG